MQAGNRAALTKPPNCTARLAIAGSTRVRQAESAARWPVRGKQDAEVSLSGHAADPETWQAPLAKALETTGASTDEPVIVAAQQLMALLDAAGARSGKYDVDVRCAKGVQVGDGNQQFNVFNRAPEIVVASWKPRISARARRETRPRSGRCARRSAAPQFLARLSVRFMRMARVRAVLRRGLWRCDGGDLHAVREGPGGGSAGDMERASCRRRRCPRRTCCRAAPEAGADPAIVEQ